MSISSCRAPFPGSSPQPRAWGSHTEVWGSQLCATPDPGEKQRHFPIAAGRAPAPRSCRNQALITFTQARSLGLVHNTNYSLAKGQEQPTWSKWQSTHFWEKLLRCETLDQVPRAGSLVSVSTDPSSAPLLLLMHRATQPPPPPTFRTRKREEEPTKKNS